MLLRISCHPNTKIRSSGILQILVQIIPLVQLLNLFHQINGKGIALGPVVSSKEKLDQVMVKY